MVPVSLISELIYICETMAGSGEGGYEDEVLGYQGEPTDSNNVVGKKLFRRELRLCKMKVLKTLKFQQMKI